MNRRSLFKLFGAGAVASAAPALPAIAEVAKPAGTAAAPYVGMIVQRLAEWKAVTASCGCHTHNFTTSAPAAYAIEQVVWDGSHWVPLDEYMARKDSNA